MLPNRARAASVKDTSEGRRFIAYTRSFRCFSHCDLCNSSPASGEIYRFLQDLEDRLRWNLKRFENDKETAYIFLCESCSRTWNMLEGTVCSSNYFCFSI